MDILKSAKRLRDTYQSGPANAAEITSFLNECLSPTNREDIAASIQKENTVYGCHPELPHKLVRVNADGTRDVGSWSEYGFQPD